MMDLGTLGSLVDPATAEATGRVSDRSTGRIAVSHLLATPSLTPTIYISPLSISVGYSWNVLLHTSGSQYPSIVHRRTRRLYDGENDSYDPPTRDAPPPGSSTVLCPRRRWRVPSVTMIGYRAGKHCTCLIAIAVLRTSRARLLPCSRR